VAAAAAPLLEEEAAAVAVHPTSDDPNALYQALAAGIAWPQPGEAGFYDRYGLAAGPAAAAAAAGAACAVPPPTWVDGW
jgi:hypothetical protein